MCISGQIHKQRSEFSANRKKDKKQRKQPPISLIYFLFLIKVFPGSNQPGGKNSLNNLPVQQTQQSFHSHIYGRFELPINKVGAGAHAAAFQLMISALKCIEHVIIL